MKYLFIGGSRDAERHAIATGYEWIRLPVRPTLDEAVTNTTPLETEEYRLLRIRGENIEFIVYAISGMSPDQTISALIGRYRRQ